MQKLKLMIENNFYAVKMKKGDKKMKEQVNFMQNNVSCKERIETVYPALSGASKKIADFVLESPDKPIHMTVVQMAESCKVSEASIVRFCKHLEYSGFYDFKLSLASEILPGNQMIQEDITPQDTEAAVLEKVFAGEQQALQETLQMIDRQDFASAVNHIAFSNKVEFFSCGNARPIAQDAHYRLLRTGIDSRIGIDDYDCLIHASMLRVGDVAIGISHSGSTKKIIKMLEEARKNGATTICITGVIKAPITRVSDICLISYSKETMFRNMAMASRIAQMAIMDALVVAVSFKRFERSRQYLSLTDKILVEDKM